MDWTADHSGSKFQFLGLFIKKLKESSLDMWPRRFQTIALIILSCHEFFNSLKIMV